MTDHLGNNRVVVNASGTVTQRNHYYPFGTAFAENTVDEQKKQPYKYNGKELDQMHGLNLYDYSARYYESAVGRFTTVDPHAENYYSWSPYAYVLNNPLKYIDPSGCDTVYVYKDGTEFDRIKAPGEDVTIYGPSEDIVVENNEEPASSLPPYIIGSYASYRQCTQYSKNLGIWRGKNGKIYTGLTGRGPNGYTGSRGWVQAKSTQIGKVSIALTGVGMFLTYKKYKYDMKQNPGPNLKRHLKMRYAQDQLFNAAGFR